MSRQRNESWSGQFHPPINSRISDVQARLLRATISTLHFHSFIYRQTSRIDSRKLVKYIAFSLLFDLEEKEAKPSRFE